MTIFKALTYFDTIQFQQLKQGTIGLYEQQSEIQEGLLLEAMKIWSLEFSIAGTAIIFISIYLMIQLPRIQKYGLHNFL